MKNFLLLLSVILSLSILGACGHGEVDYEAVYNKIKQGNDLNVSDYETMLDYINDVCTALNQVKNVEDLQNIEKQYAYAGPFMNELNDGNPSEEVKGKLEKKAQKVLENFQKAQETVTTRISSNNQ